MKRAVAGVPAIVFVLCGLLAGAAKAQPPGVVAHEWGTFTSIAGNSGTAVEWYPWAVPTDLPEFVEHFESADFKPNLSGTIRMETPVLYFYSAEATTVSVHVAFSKGLITEWYPPATNHAPKDRNFLEAAFARGVKGDGSAAWDRVMLRPSGAGSPPHEKKDSRYYAARLTNSTPLEVRTAKGTAYEKFIFYRGVSSEASPANAKVLSDGNVEVVNLTGEPVARLFWFERRGSAAGIRAVAGLEGNAVLEPPPLTAAPEAAASALLSALMDQGLYPDEAQAMLDTWRESWFEEGSRLLYIVPQSFVNRVLPLSITPEPAETTRVFVGRLELVTAKTGSAVLTALGRGDERTLAQYNRFLEPILAILLEREPDPLKARLIRLRLNRPYATGEAAASAAGN
ncbi:MAG TPA: hypothetical protein VKB24_02560 [Candidatus Acidoferrum sp.]|nr:hypothetical protein [Candidatus Acidoferrum sp.]